MTKRTLSYTVPPEQAGRRVRSILQGELRLSAGFVARLKHREGSVRLNGVPARTIDAVRAGDTLTVDVGDAEGGGHFAPMAHGLDILWEDDDLLMLDKPAGMATHGRALRGECTVAYALAAYLGTESPFHPVNRLDRGTTGVMCIAKTGYVHDRLRTMLHSDSFRRDYLAIAAGTVVPAAGTVALPIARIGDKKFGTRPDGASSITRYETIASGAGVTLLHILPETGRTHQIRVHFAAIGFPLLGDALYGKASPEILRPALHSASLRLIHPVTGKEIKASAPLPEDIREVLENHEISAPGIL